MFYCIAHKHITPSLHILDDITELNNTLNRNIYILALIPYCCTLFLTTDNKLCIIYKLTAINTFIFGSIHTGKLAKNSYLLSIKDLFSKSKKAQRKAKSLALSK